MFNPYAAPVIAAKMAIAMGQAWFMHASGLTPIYDPKGERATPEAAIKSRMGIQIDNKHS